MGDTNAPVLRPLLGRECNYQTVFPLSEGWRVKGETAERPTQAREDIPGENDARNEVTPPGVGRSQRARGGALRHTLSPGGVAGEPGGASDRRPHAYLLLKSRLDGAGYSQKHRREMCVKNDGLFLRPIGCTHIYIN